MLTAEEHRQMHDMTQAGPVARDDDRRGVLSAVSDATMRLVKEQFGRGPTRPSTGSASRSSG
jgi:hypothetical protein